MNLVRLPLVFAAVVLGAALYAGPARACAACACGTAAPTGAGVDVPFAGRLRAGLLWDNAAVSDEHNVIVATQARAALWWAPTRDTVLDASVPFGARVRFDDDTGEKNGNAAHLADASVGVRLVLLRDRLFGPRNVASMRIGATLPTGPEVTRAPSADAPKGGPAAVPLAPELQPARGAVMPRIDVLWLAIPSERLQVIAQAGGEAPMIGVRELVPAPSADASAVLQWIPKDGVGLRLGASGRVIGAETRKQTSAPAGQRASASVSAGVLVQPLQDLLLVLDVAVPVAQTTWGGGIARDRMMTSVSLIWDVPAPRLR
jgi:hypothetical protein